MEVTDVTRERFVLEWSLRSDSIEVKCPYCGEVASVADVILYDRWPITPLGFSFGECPKCRGVVTFDFDRAVVTKAGEGRKPFPVFMSFGRILNGLLSCAAIALLLTGSQFWLPVLFLSTVGLELSWERVLKRANPMWYCTGAGFEFVTNRLASVGLCLSLVRVVVIVASVVMLLKG